MEGRLARRLFGTGLIAGSVALGGCAILREQARIATPESHTISATAMAAAESSVLLEPQLSAEEIVARNFVTAAISGDREKVLLLVSPAEKDKNPFVEEFITRAIGLFGRCDPGSLRNFSLVPSEEGESKRVAQLQADCPGVYGITTKIKLTLDVSSPEVPVVVPGLIGVEATRRPLID